MPVTIGALRERAPQETRVSLVPEVADKLAQTGAKILLEKGAGTSAQFPDSAYKNVTWADSPTAVLEQYDETPYAVRSRPTPLTANRAIWFGLRWSLGGGVASTRSRGTNRAQSAASPVRTLDWAAPCRRRADH